MTSGSSAAATSAKAPCKPYTTPCPADLLLWDLTRRSPSSPWREHQPSCTDEMSAQLLHHVLGLDLGDIRSECQLRSDSTLPSRRDAAAPRHHTVDRCQTRAQPKSRRRSRRSALQAAPTNVIGGPSSARN